MQSESEQKLNNISFDFKVKIKNHIPEFEKLQEATEKKTQTRDTEVAKRQRRKITQSDRCT